MNDFEEYANFISDIKSVASDLYGAIAYYCLNNECVNCKFSLKFHDCHYLKNLLFLLHGYAMATPVQEEKNAIENFLQTEFPNFKYPLQ